MWLESEIYVSTPRCFMSTFLLTSDGGTPQNIRLNVFVKVMRSIARHFKCKIIASQWLSFRKCLQLQNWPRVKRCGRQTDRWTDIQIDRQTDWTSHRTACSQLKRNDVNWKFSAFTFKYCLVVHKKLYISIFPTPKFYSMLIWSIFIYIICDRIQKRKNYLYTSIFLQ